MNNYKDDIFQLSYFIRTTLGSMMNLVDEMSTKELTNERKNGYLDVMRYFIDSILGKMDELSSGVLPTKDIIQDSINNLKFKDAHVLLVDDNEINNYVAEQILKNFNVQVDVATSGKQALELYKTHEYDIVFMDYMMPEMNGIDTIKAIRRTGERGEQQMFVGLSSYVVEAFHDGLNKLGVELIIMKPIKLEQVGIILLNELRDKVVM